MEYPISKLVKFGYITIGFVMDVSSHDHEELGGRRIRQRVKEWAMLTGNQMEVQKPVPHILSFLILLRKWNLLKMKCLLVGLLLQLTVLSALLPSSLMTSETFLWLCTIYNGIFWKFLYTGKAGYAGSFIAQLKEDKFLLSVWPVVLHETI